MQRCTRVISIVTVFELWRIQASGQRRGTLSMRIARTPKTGRLAISLLAGASMLALAPAAAAQQAEEPEDSQTTILVTALKREQDLQDVPMAITALGEESIGELHINELRDAV